MVQGLAQGQDHQRTAFGVVYSTIAFISENLACCLFFVSLCRTLGGSDGDDGGIRVRLFGADTLDVEAIQARVENMDFGEDDVGSWDIEQTGA